MMSRNQDPFEDQVVSELNQDIGSQHEDESVRDPECQPQTCDAQEDGDENRG